MARNTPTMIRPSRCSSTVTSTAIMARIAENSWAASTGCRHATIVRPIDPPRVRRTPTATTHRLIPSASSAVGNTSRMNAGVPSCTPAAVVAARKAIPASIGNQTAFTRLQRKLSAGSRECSQPTHITRTQIAAAGGPPYRTAASTMPTEVPDTRTFETPELTDNSSEPTV
jgi:hypothetical protein